ncbi:beta-propeller fold lactonase family protein [Caballeronia sp. SEWSISQ10-4 2]|uniref:beta-propeller fold lactonase family protein n=1 Tax=Caballeronia sp. SEWSISQ10-4 2 TaxID=2937438 RepID=UPI0034628924
MRPVAAVQSVARHASHWRDGIPKSARESSLLVQRSDQIAIFAVDAASGKLRFTGTYVAVGSPSDIAFASPVVTGK